MDEVGGDGDEHAREDHYVLSVRLVDVHPSKIGLEALELVVIIREATLIQCPTRQQQLGAAANGRFHNDASSRH